MIGQLVGNCTYPEESPVCNFLPCAVDSSPVEMIRISKSANHPPRYQGFFQILVWPGGIVQHSDIVIFYYMKNMRASIELSSISMYIVTGT